MAYVYIYVYNKPEVTSDINVYEVSEMTAMRGMCQAHYICPKKPDDISYKTQCAFVSPHPMVPFGRSCTVNLWCEERDDEKAAKLITEFRLKEAIKAEALAAKRLMRLEKERDILVDGLVVEPRMRKEA